MTAVRSDYHARYTRAGDVAILCEGDVAGYEAAMLSTWTDVSLGRGPLVDVWACGTSSALFGLSDAIGRARPLFVIEDRDYRTPSEAAEDCKKKLNPRGV